MARREQWRWTGFAALVLAALVLRLWRGGEVAPAEPMVTPESEQLATGAPLPSLPLSGGPSPLPTERAWGGPEDAGEPAPEPEEESRDVTYELDSIRDAIERYLADGGVAPAGGNAAWFTALTGAGPGGEAVLPPDHASIGASGLLVDPWGSAFLFQPTGPGWLEIRSSGPDRLFQTEDDMPLLVPLTRPVEGAPPPLEAEELGAGS